MKRIVTTLLLLLTWELANASDKRPTGVNCKLTKPPVGSGEESGHGFLLQVFPRTGNIGSQYTGCQAVFAVSQAQGVRLVWLVEVVRGMPVRMWSEDKEMKNVLSCRYANGKLKQGNPKTCSPAHSLLLPTQPAGCLTKVQENSECDYDLE